MSDITIRPVGKVRPPVIELAKVDTVSATVGQASAGKSLSFGKLKGTPVAWFIRCTNQIGMQNNSRYIVNMRYNGDSVEGNYYWIPAAGSPQVGPDTTHYSYTLSRTLSFTAKTTGEANSGGGIFRPGATYELTYAY